MIEIDWTKYDIVHCGISGGKDSQAAATWLVQDSGCPVEKIRLSFCDTGNEIDLTYDHVRYIEQMLGVPIAWIKNELDFYQLAAKKHRFPSVKARFCTEYLKMQVAQRHILQWMQAGLNVLLITGVRAGESEQRAKLLPLDFDTYFACDIYRPLFDWSLERVLDYLKGKGQQINPLYSYGARRVGCYPCIMSRKLEIRQIANNFPERIDMIREQEQSISSTFFNVNVVPPKFRKTVHANSDGSTIRVASIDDVVRWSMTKSHGRGKGKEFEDGPQGRLSFYEDLPTCINSSGMCE